MPYGRRPFLPATGGREMDILFPYAFFLFHFGLVHQLGQGHAAAIHPEKIQNPPYSFHYILRHQPHSSSALPRHVFLGIRVRGIAGRLGWDSPVVRAGVLPVFVCLQDDSQTIHVQRGPVASSRRFVIERV